MSFTPHWKSKEQTLKLEWPPGPRVWLSTARKMGESPITIIYIDICCIKWFSYFKCYFIENFVSEGSRFLSPGVPVVSLTTTLKAVMGTAMLKRSAAICR
jgi:hypothetical protein